MQTMWPEVLEKHLKHSDRVMLQAVRTVIPYGRVTVVQSTKTTQETWRWNDQVGVGRRTDCIYGRHLHVCVVVHTVGGWRGDGVSGDRWPIRLRSFDVWSENSRFDVLIESDNKLGKELRTHFLTMWREVLGDMSDDEVSVDSPFKFGSGGLE